MINLLTYGNHARDVEVIYRRSGGTGLLRYDDDPSVARLIPDDLEGPIVIGNNDSGIRRDIAERFAHLPGAEPIVDPSAIIGPDVYLGPGVVIAPMAVLLHSVTLGAHVHCNYSVSMTRCKVGDFSTICPGATLCGNVTIGEGTLVGAGATICERTTIGSNVTIGAGAVVPPWSVVPDDTRVLGIWKQ